MAIHRPAHADRERKVRHLDAEVLRCIWLRVQEVDSPVSPGNGALMVIGLHSLFPILKGFQATASESEMGIDGLLAQ